MSASSRQTFAATLTRLLAQTRRRALGHGLSVLGTWVGGGVLIAAWTVGGDLEPGALITGGLAVCLLAGTAVLATRWLLRPWYELRRREDFVRFVERQGAFGNMLIAAEEALRRPERWRADSDLGRALIDRLYRRATLQLTHLRPEDILPQMHRRKARWGLVATCGLWLLALVSASSDITQGLDRLRPPWSSDHVTVTGGMYAVVDATEITAGQDLVVEAVDFAGGQTAAVCQIKLGSGLWQTVTATLQPAPPRALGLPAPYRRWQAVIPDVRQDLAWRFRRDLIETAPQQVVVHPFPLLTGIAAVVRPPAYTHMPAGELERLPADLEVLAGSRLDLTAQANRTLIWAGLALAGGDTLPLQVDGAAVAGSVRADTSLAFQLLVTDDHGLTNQAPMVHRIAATPDRAPLVALSRPEDDGTLPVAGDITLQVTAADDFGITEVQLLVRTVAEDDPAVAVEEVHWTPVRFWSAGEAMTTGDGFGPWQAVDTGVGDLRLRCRRADDRPDRLQTEFVLEVQAGHLDLISGDALLLMAEVLDNKQPLPAGRGRSGVLRLVLPSAADVLTAQAEMREERSDSLEEMRRRSRLLEADLDRLTRELLKNPVPDWSRQQEMEAAIKRQQALQKELGQVADQLQQDLDALVRNQLTDQQALDKAEEISQLLSNSRSDALNDLLQKMDQAADQITPEEVAEAMAEVAKQQKELARKMDAALAMLKRMAQEQELEGLASLLAQMIQKQQELAELSRELAARHSEHQEDQEESEQASASEADEETQADAQDAAAEGAESEQDQAGDSASSETGDKAQDPADQSDQPQDSAENSEAAQPPSTEELARRQEALAEELDELRDKLAEALEQMQQDGTEQEPTSSEQQLEQALEQALEQLDQQRQQNDMQQASESLQQMDPEMAAQLQEQALRDLGSLYHVLLETQQAMQMAMQEHQVSSLRRLAADLLSLSARQEQLYLDIPDRLRDIRTQDLTRGQHRLQRSTILVREQLAELMDEAPMRILALVQKLDGLIEEMGSGVQALEDNRGPVARNHASAALAAANNIVIGLLTEAQVTSDSGGGGGSSSQSMSQQLKEMAQQQAGLNGATEELRRMLANRGLSQEVRAQMQRLGQSQGDLAGRMQDLAEQEQQTPEGERLLGDLGELGRQMERVTDEIDQGLVSEETLIRQERILSRLLDARNSVRRRDYTNRRESRRSLHLFEEQAGTDLLPPDDEQGSRFRLRYQPLEKAPAEYRDLVRRYFAAVDSLRRLQVDRDRTGLGTTEGDLP